MSKSEAIREHRRKYLISAARDRIHGGVKDSKILDIFAESNQISKSESMVVIGLGLFREGVILASIGGGGNDVQALKIYANLRQVLRDQINDVLDD